ncbi:hypothetical protein OEIGOIKO_03997 [Streptomyces chrestomyceticus JCM 4735]|uniref:Serine/threonine protein kinase n=1 Tax=Streptomyces chrestomyceticus JCM 4735 TaxID=1306181 RepID=A0A7U9KVM1_9ACTN|nr:hypothetical protein [Streptomyces chrestomyceticus]GCD36237.1 hypothetical protein OEIGOIKO_03997 [Streptomyces chrestomyceticus JCM 4735]
MERAPNLRMIALASTVALAVALPLAAATAGPAESDRSAADGSASAAHPDADVPVGTRASAARGPAPGPSRGAHPVPRTGAPADSRTDPRTDSRSGPRSDSGTAADGRRTTRCGPELAAPEGVEAQTCVLTEGGLTWGRTYYRNTSGKPLRAVLSLLRPDGRTVQAHCDLPAGDEPATCETPREATVGGDRAPYTAVVEIADARGERKLLRSGSNAAPDAGGSDQ